MSHLMRMTYGHGGTRLKRVLVAAPPAAPAAAPRWLKILFLTVWIVVPLFICRFSLPTLTPTTTVIDTSRLVVQPAAVPPAVPEPRIMPVAPLPRPAPLPAQTAPKEPSPKVADRPDITRPALARSAEVPEYQPRMTRQRRQPDTEKPSTAETPIRRALPPTETPLEQSAITRTRGATAGDLPAVRERRTPTLRRAAVEEIGGGTDVTLRPVARRERPEESHATPQVAALRERREAAGTGEGEAARGAGLVRGVSLASLEICSSPRAEEDAVRAVLGAVGSRRNCRDETGEYQFTGTRRVSSFNLMIRPAKGRRPTNRCEELENAYSCLKAH